MSKSTAFFFFLIHLYATSYYVYRKWVCGTATAKALSSECYFNRPVLLTQLKQQCPKLPQNVGEGAEMRYEETCFAVFTDHKCVCVFLKVCKLGRNGTTKKTFSHNPPPTSLPLSGSSRKCLKQRQSCDSLTLPTDGFQWNKCLC